MAKTARKWDQRQLMTGGITLWVAIVALFFLWEIVTYSGIMALLAEWQFNVFGSYFPTVTYLALVTLLASPGLLLFLRARRRGPQQCLESATLRSATIFRRVLLGIAAACLGAAVVTLLLILTLPTGVGTPRHLDLARPVLGLTSEGATTITGAILYDRTAALNEDVLVTRRNWRFAPIVEPGSADLNLQFFVELPPTSGAHSGATAAMTGVLKRNALPGEIVRLYRYAGYSVERPYYVLFASDATLRWPYFELAAELGLAALLFLAIGFWQHRRIVWIKKTVAPSEH